MLKVYFQITNSEVRIAIDHDRKRSFNRQGTHFKRAKGMSTLLTHGGTELKLYNVPGKTNLYYLRRTNKAEIAKWTALVEGRI